MIAWANGFGVWHVRVPRSNPEPLAAASERLREEIEARYPAVSPKVWADPEPVPDLDDTESLVYREGTP